MVASAGGAQAGARPASGHRASGTWGKAEEVPGTALERGAQVDWVSCAAAGNCSASGEYATIKSGAPQEFVVGQVNGTWRKAEAVPGVPPSNPDYFEAINSLSCASAGNCSAFGSILSQYSYRNFVVSEVHGAWETAKDVPGSGTAPDNTAVINSVSCAPAGSCSAGGALVVYGYDRADILVTSQVRGTWEKVKAVPGTAALNTGGAGAITSVSCASSGNCSAGGYYADGRPGSGHPQAFVVSQVHGTWDHAKEVPGTATLNKGGNAAISRVSCASAGNCGASGYYKDRSGHQQAFVVSQVNGTWGKAQEAPGTAGLNKGGNAVISSLSCTSAGNCSAGGYYQDRSGHQQVFVLTEIHGKWGKAQEAWGTAALNKGGNAAISSLSCASPGNCSAGGYYTDSSGHSQAFIVSQVHGAWHKAHEAWGTAALNKGGDATISSLSCAPRGTCSAGGHYLDGHRHYRAFVVSQT
jgi:hypothetical protein